MERSRAVACRSSDTLSPVQTAQLLLRSNEHIKIDPNKAMPYTKLVRPESGGAKVGHLFPFCNKRRRDRGSTPWNYI